MEPERPEIPVGGRLKLFSSRWAKLTSDPNVLDIVSGMHIELDDIPKQTRFPQQIIVTQEEQAAASEHIQSLLDKKAIVRCGVVDPGKYFSNIFMIPKRDFGWRMILNLKLFNRHVTYVHFKMQTLSHILANIQYSTHMATFDFCDAYLTIPLAGEHVKFFKFRFNNGVFMYVVLPFGISSPPRKFTKVLIPILSFLRRQAIIVIAYLDDGFTCAPTFQECYNNIAYIMHTFSYFGFIIHKKKSSPLPSTQVRSLGFHINSLTMNVTIPSEKIENALFLCNTVLSQSQSVFTIQYLAQLIGTLISLFPACPLGRAHYRTLERLKVAALRLSGGDFDGSVIFTSECLQDLKWWVYSLPSTAYPIHRGLPSDILHTDSSDYGWSGVFQSQTANGHFTLEEKDNIIAFKELLAIYYAIHSFHSQFTGNFLLVRSDSVCAVAYLRDMGGMKNVKMDILARDIWDFAVKHDFWIYVSYLPGSENSEADAGSRLISTHMEWALPQILFDYVCKQVTTPTIDAFASRINAKLPRYISWFPDTYCTFVDAFSVSWSNEIPYFCPFPKFTDVSRK